MHLNYFWINGPRRWIKSFLRIIAQTTKLASPNPQKARKNDYYFQVTTNTFIKEKKRWQNFTWNHLIKLICITDIGRVFKNTKSSKSQRTFFFSSKYFYISILPSISSVDLNRKSKHGVLHSWNICQQRYTVRYLAALSKWPLISTSEINFN